MYKVIVARYNEPIYYIARWKPLRYLLKWLYRQFFYGPHTVQLHITDKCNLKCIYCYSRGKILKKINWKNLIKEAKRLGSTTVDFLGGEPFLSNDLLELIKLAIRLRLNVNIYTNGLKLDKSVLKYCELHKNKVSFIIKFEYNKKMYKYITKRDCFEEVCQNIKYLSDIGFKVFTQTALTKKNWRFVESIMKKSRGLGAVPVFERYMPQNSKVDKELSIGKREFNYCIEKIKNFLEKEYGFEYLILPARIKGNICFCYNEILSIQSDGTVLPCPFSSKEEAVGNVLKQPLKDIWTEYTNKKKTMWYSQIQACKGCPHLEYCHGGCKSYTFLKTKSYGKDPLCDGNNSPLIGLCGRLMIKSVKNRIK